MIREWLETYKAGTLEETGNALREILQEIALAGLHRGGFFKYAAFYGGTALRIFYGLPRFSEDLDFTLLEKDPDFDISDFLEAVRDEMEAYGLSVELHKKDKAFASQIDSAFLKTDTIWQELELTARFPQLTGGSIPAIRIKLEVDIDPPLHFETEQKLLLRPFSFYVNTLTLPDLFAGKLHALLFRQWGNRVKGRDWFDMEWYIRRETPVSLRHFSARALESWDLKVPLENCEQLRALLLERIATVDIGQAKADIQRFIPRGSTALDIWSRDYFADLVGYLRCDVV